jgi:hypothetical protein
VYLAEAVTIRLAPTGQVDADPDRKREQERERP